MTSDQRAGSAGAPEATDANRSPEAGVGGRVAVARVQGTPLSVDEVLAMVRHDRAGAVALFVGQVRDHDDGRQVLALDYSAHPSADAVAAGLAARYAARPGVEVVALVHRVGSLGVGDVAIVAAVSAAHRREAFTACAELVEEVKATLPIWKHQRFSDGTQEWVGLDSGGSGTPTGGSTGSEQQARIVGGRGARHTGRWWRPRRSRWRPWMGLAIGLALSMVVAILATVIPVPYAVLKPGPATDVLAAHQTADGTSTPRIVISGATTYPTTGALEFTTVRVSGGPGYPVNAWDLLYAWISPSEDVFPVEELFPPQATQEQVAEENKAEMAGSQQDAAAVALRALGKDVRAVVVIRQVVAGAPSEGELRAGDILVSIGGTPASDSAAIRAAIQGVAPGDAVEVIVERAGSRVTTHPRTRRADDGRTVLGILLASDYQLPFSVTIDAGSVGGPSAGLMFSLGIYDVLTEGSLTGGATIAGTGTIDGSGAVGPIGGIAQKMVGARQSGAAFFLAPADNCSEVHGREPHGLQVIKVATFEEARAALVAIGAGNVASLPHC